MSIIQDILNWRHSQPRQYAGSLLWLFSEFQCKHGDELLFQGVTQDYVPPLACKFNRDGLHGNLLAVADEEGGIGLFDTRKTLSKSQVLDFDAHKNAIFDITWLPGGTKLVTASGDRTVRLWDVVGETLLTTFVGHIGSVKSVDVKCDEPSVFVSGGRDGRILMWDTRCSGRGSTHKPVNGIYNAHERNKEEPKKSGRSVATVSSSPRASVTAVLFHGDNKIASCGASDGTVKLWDLRRHYLSNKKIPPPAWHSFATVEKGGRAFGFNSLISDPDQSFLFASSMDNIIYKYSTTTLNKAPVDAFSGHKNSMFYVKTCLSHDGNYLLSGSNCGNAFIWQVDKSEAPPLLLSGHDKEVTAVDWCPTSIEKIATCSDNNDLRLWRIIRDSYKSDEARIPGERIGSCVTYSGEGHLKAREVMKNYRVPAEPEPRVCGCTDTIPKHNTMKPCTALPENTEKKDNVSKENNCGNNITSQLSSSMVRSQRSSSSSSNTSPVNSKQLLSSTPTSQTHSIIYYLTPTSRQNVEEDKPTDGKQGTCRSKGKNSVRKSRVSEETPERLEQRLSTANGRKRKLNLSTDQRNSKRRKGSCRVKRKEVSVDTNSSSCSPCGQTSPAVMVVAKKQTTLKQDQPSLQRYFKPKLDHD